MDDSHSVRIVLLITYSYIGDRTALCIIKVIIIIAKYSLKSTIDAIFYNVHVMCAALTVYNSFNSRDC